MDENTVDGNLLAGTSTQQAVDASFGVSMNSAVGTDYLPTSIAFFSDPATGSAMRVLNGVTHPTDTAMVFIKDAQVVGRIVLMGVMALVDGDPDTCAQVLRNLMTPKK